MALVVDSLIARFSKVNENQEILIPELHGNSYEFKFSFPDITIYPGDIIAVESGIICEISSPYCLLLFPHRSILNLSDIKIKDPIRLYQNKPKQIAISIHNKSNKPFILKHAQPFASGLIFESPKPNIIN